MRYTMGYTFERESPYDKFDKFRLPLLFRISLLFFSRDEKKKIKNRIDKINRVRGLDLKREIDEMRKIMRPRPQRSS